MASWPPRSWTRNTSGRTWRTAGSRSTSKNCRPEDLRGTYLYLEVRAERCHLLRTSVKYAPGGLALPEDGVIAPNRTLTAIRGVRVGHAQDLRQRTGCSVVLLTPPAMAFADARGGWPGTYDTAASDLGKTFIERHALLLTGGDVYGFDAAAGIGRLGGRAARREKVSSRWTTWSRTMSVAPPRVSGRRSVSSGRTRPSIMSNSPGSWSWRMTGLPSRSDPLTCRPMGTRSSDFARESRTVHESIIGPSMRCITWRCEKWRDPPFEESGRRRPSVGFLAFGNHELLILEQKKKEGVPDA